MPEKYSKFRNSSNQRMLTGLFLETRPPGQQAEPLYTLRDWDHTRPNGEFFPSLYLLYLAENDPTEILFANKHMDGWEHWQMLVKCTFFKPYILRWREELSLKLKAEALQRLLLAAQNVNSKTYVEINKYLASEAYLPKKTARGRPSKAEIQASLKSEASREKDLAKDFERISQLGEVILPESINPKDIN